MTTDKIQRRRFGVHTLIPALSLLVLSVVYVVNSGPSRINTC